MEQTPVSFLTPIMAQLQRQIAESNYEGWVAWVDGVPIFEKSVATPKLGMANHAPGQFVLPQRAEGRNVMDWKDLPHEKIDMVDLYLARENIHWTQPCWSVPRLPDCQIAYIMLKMGGVVLHTRPGATSGQERLGNASGYKMGFWIPSANECRMWEITRKQITPLGVKQDPHSPRPTGFGISHAAIHRVFS